MKVKFTDLYKIIHDKKKILSKINQLIKNSRFVGGYEVENFERAFAKYTGSKYAVSLANGTDALEIAVSSLNLKEGSEAIVPVNTWISTAEAILKNNLKIVFCDINLKDYSICLKDLKTKINKKTKLIMPVHLFGNPTSLPSIKKLIKNKNINIIEDCAQAHGTRINGRHVGTFGDVGTFSFFPGKNLGGFGDGGALITNSKTIFERALRMRNHGAKIKYDHKFPGRNSRLDTLQAAVLNIKLKKYNGVVKKRNKLAQLYMKNLRDCKDVVNIEINNNNTYAFHQFVIRVNKRDSLMKYLRKSGIDTMIHYPYMLNELNFFPKGKNLINSKNLGKKILSLPISEEHTESEINYISKKIIQFYHQ